MIEKLELKNFKSIRNADIALGKLNILIGKNGAGKSNFLSFFNLLQQGANGGKNNKAFNSVINSMGGFSEIRHYEAVESDENLSWEITFKQIADIEELYYKGVLSSRGYSGYTIQLEEISRPPYPSYEERFKYLSASNGRVRILKSVKDEDESEVHYDESDQELIIAQVRDSVRYPSLADVQTEIADWQIFRGFGSDALRNIRTPQILNPIEPLRLDVSGNNLVSILQELKNQRKYQDVYDKLVQIMQTVFTDFVQPDIQIVSGGMGSLSYRSNSYPVSVPAISMSDGQLRFLGLLILLLLPDPPSLIAIDEPEIGLHPEMLDIFVELLQQTSERTQIIITTHSPRLIDFASPEDIIIVDRKEGQTTLERFSPYELQKLQSWYELYTLGKLWTMGKLHA